MNMVGFSIIVLNHLIKGFSSGFIQYEKYKNESQDASSSINW